VKGNNEEDIKNEAEKALRLHCNYLDDNGMVINKQTRLLISVTKGLRNVI